MADTTDKRVRDLLTRYAARERDFARQDLSSTALSGANLSGAILFEAHLSGADLSGANLHRADISKAALSGADLSGANLSGADLSEADLSGADLSGANLVEADLSKANLSGADLHMANLSGANLSETELTWAELDGANLSEANLIGAELSGAKLCGVSVEKADFCRSRCGRTVFAAVDLRPAIGLEEIVHNGPSTIGIDTLYRSHGEIPEAFMRGCGVHDEFVTFARSLVGKALDFYSCFISYSSKDEKLAGRLYADLQANHVRCWYAPEDLKIGDKFRQKIDETIQVYDKVVIVLSENSIGSDWVESEVEAALEKERKTKKTVLFPIRLDEAVMDCKIAWAAEIRRTRHIGEFGGWKDHDAYKRAFERVLRDLKAEEAPQEE